MRRSPGAAAFEENVPLLDSIDTSVFDLVLSASIITQAVLIVLLIFSLVSWAIIFQKFFLFRKAAAEDKRFFALYWKVDNLVELRKTASRFRRSPVARIFLAGMERLDPGFALKSGDDLRAVEGPGGAAGLKILERTLKRSVDEQVGGLESYLSFLATTGNVSPFIGLFGTVLGIISAFQGISRQGTASITAVAPGVSEALVATAAGLLAAIPAVVAYNYYVSRIRVMASGMETFSTEFLSLVEERAGSSGASRVAGADKVGAGRVGSK
ncbi:MAG TPA: MotA/TolQ/ExbB proton channel family protein [Nitrospiria bacterium]|nr:MotA/TolQ/ExbB proton channel family protein [Nitrospiria bacterium]